MAWKSAAEGLEPDQVHAPPEGARRPQDGPSLGRAVIYYIRFVRCHPSPTGQA